MSALPVISVCEKEVAPRWAPFVRFLRGRYFDTDSVEPCWPIAWSGPTLPLQSDPISGSISTGRAEGPPRPTCFPSTPTFVDGNRPYLLPFTPELLSVDIINKIE